MATDIRQCVLDGAGDAMRELRAATNPAEAQVAMAMMALFLCSQYEVQPAEFAHVMLHNMKQVGNDPALLSRVVETIHNASTKGSIVVPKEPEAYHYRVGDLLRKQRH